MSADGSTAGDAARKLNPLTSLRFLAAALIVVHHAKGKFGIPESLASSVSFGAGVSFFFVLSGFILTYVHASRPRLEKRRFLLARVARIWPAHVASMALMWLLLPQIFESRFTPGRFLASLAMVHAWIPKSEYFFAFVSASWSISTEFGFYLCFLLLALNWSRTWPLKLCASLAALIAMIALTNHLVGTSPAAESDLLGGLIMCNPITRLFEFTLGMTTAHFWSRWRSRIRVGGAIGTAMEAGAFLLLGVVIFHGIPWAQAAGKMPVPGKAGVAWLAHGGVACWACAILIFVLALERGLISRLLSSSFLVLLGEISYSIYLVHQTVFIFFHTRRQSFEMVPGWLALAWACALTLVISYLVWACIERPCRRFLVGLWPRPSNAVAVELPASMIAPDGVPVNPAWPRLVMPSTIGAVLGLTMLALLAAPAVYLVKFRPTIRTVTIEQARQIIGSDSIGGEDVHFGDAFVLLGASAKRVGDELHLHLLWQATGLQRLDWLAAIHFMDETGRIVAQADHPQDRSNCRVADGTVWDDFVRFPMSRLGGAKAVGLGFLKKDKSWLFADRGTRDMGDRRLSLALPETLAVVPAPAASATSLTGFFEAANATSLVGWVWDSSQPDRRVSVGIYDDATLIATVVADQFRPDLEKGRIGDGRSGFRVATPDALRDGKSHTLHARPVGTEYELRQSPRAAVFGNAQHRTKTTKTEAAP